MAESVIRFPFIIKFTFLYFSLSLIYLHKVECQHPVENRKVEEKNYAPVPNEYQAPFRDPVPNEYQAPFRAPVLNDHQAPFRAPVPNEYQAPFGAPVPNEYQAPFGAQVPNEVQAQFEPQLQNEFQPQYVAQMPNLGDNWGVQFGTQPPNNIQLPNAAQLQSYPKLFGDILNPPVKVIPKLFSGFIINAFMDGLKDNQKNFFDDMENDAYMSIKSDLKQNVSLECLNSLKDLQNGLIEGKQWALRMIDSFGKLPNGILDGSVRSFGDFDMCVNTIIPEFQGRYCLVSISPAGLKRKPPRTYINMANIFERDFTKPLHSSNTAVGYFEIFLTTAICLPSKCSHSEVQDFLSKVASYYTQSVDYKVTQCMVKHEFTLNSTQNKILFAIIFLLLFESFATYLDVRLRDLYGEQFNTVELSKTVQCILAFSYYSNTIRLFKKDENRDSVKIFHGMKVFSLSWVIMGHTLSFNVEALGRLYDAAVMWSGFFIQLLQNATLATETFFFISGFLVIYSFVKKNSPRISFILFAIYRFIRLMPPVLFILGCLFLSESWSSGPLWKEYVVDFLIGSCKSTWWMNLLFINNLFTLSTTCLPWTWYIAADMQLYLTSYVMLQLMRRNPKRAVLVLKLLIVASVIGLVIFHIVYDLPPSSTLIYITYAARPYFINMIYIKPYNHITSYCMGMIMGYFISTKTKIRMSKAKKLFGWFVSIIFFLVCGFGTYAWNHRGRIATVAEAALYGGTQRLMWSIMLSWVIYLCLNGEAGKIKSILSAGIFVPLGRLTYMAYLVHPLVQLLTLGQLKYVIFPEMKLVMYSFMAFLMTSYMFAFVTCLICESPFSRLISILISSKLGKSDKKNKEDFSV